MDIKIVCLNVWLGGVVFEPMVDFLKKEKADIYMLQEVFDDKDEALPNQYRTFDVLKRELELGYEHFAPAFVEDVEGREIVQGNAIYSRFPLTEMAVTHYDVPFGKRINDREYFSVSPRSLQHVTARTDDCELHLLNTQGIWGEDGGDSPRRLLMAKHILEQVGNNRPLILAGDLNVNPKTKTISMIEDRLTNVFKDELQTTFNIKRKDLVKYSGFATAVVDMVFTTSDIKVTGHECKLVDVSDHLPLIVNVEI